MSVSTLQQTSIHSDKDHTSIRSITSLERNALQYANDYARLQSPKLNAQRTSLTDSKEQELATLSVVAKLEHAIGRRYSMQDAEFTIKAKKQVIEKTSTPATASAPEKA